MIYSNVFKILTLSALMSTKLDKRLNWFVVKRKLSNMKYSSHNFS